MSDLNLGPGTQGAKPTVEQQIEICKQTGAPYSSTILQIVSVTQGQYDALEKDDNTLYVIGDADVGSGGNITTVFGREGDVVALPGDYDADDIAETAARKWLTTAAYNKLNAIEDGAKDDQTGAEIAALLFAEADTNNFTDAEKTKLANLVTVNNKLDATAAPTSNDDGADTAGNGTFEVGSLWVDVNNDESYRCLDNTTGAAVWSKTSLDASELAAVAISGNISDLIGTLSTGQIGNAQVTLSKIENINQNTFIGRIGAGAGVPEELTAANARTILNVEDGATADQSDAEIETAYNNQVAAASQAEAEGGIVTSIRRFTPERIKQAIASLVPDTVTAAFVRTLGFFDVTNHGTGSGLDADLLDGNHAAHILDRTNHTGTQDLSTISDSGTAAALDVPATGDAASGEVVKGDDTRLTDDRTPLAHTHTALDISNSTIPGRALLTAATVSAQQALLNVEDGADVTDATNISDAGAPIISSGAGAPSSTPTKEGDIYIDTTGDDAYIAVGTASSADWELSNGGAALPAGGTTDQILRKNSETDGDASWSDEGGGAFMVWAEDSSTAGLDSTAGDNSDGKQWSFGNGDESVDGIIIPIDCTITEIGLVSDGTMTGADVEILKNDVATGAKVTGTGTALTASVSASFTKNDRLTFKTNAGSGTTTGMVVSALAETAGVRGDVGPQGPTGVGVPAGGTTGQILEKIDGTDYNTQWADNAGGGGGGGVVETSIWIDAAAMVSDNTTGPAVATITGTNTDVDVLDFDATTDEIAFCKWSPPPQWDEGQISVEFVWSSDETTGDVVWGASALSIGDDEGYDATAFPAATTVTSSANATALDLVIDETPAFSVGSTPTVGNLILIRLVRDADVAGDTKLNDARLFGVRVKYSVTTQLEVLGFACSDKTTVLDTGGERVSTAVPFDFTVTRVYGSLTTAPTTSFTVDVEDAGVTIFNSEAALSFGTTKTAEVDGVFAGAAATYALTKGDDLTIDIGTGDAGATAAGLKVYIEGYRT